MMTEIGVEALILFVETALLSGGIVGDVLYRIKPQEYSNKD